MNELAKLTDKILQEAQEAAQRTLQAAREEGEKTLEAARAQGAKEAQAILDNARRQAEAVAHRAQSQKGVEERSVKLAARRQAIDQAFQLALERLCGAPAEKMAPFLAEMAAKAAGPGGELIFNEKDQALGAQVVELANKALAGRKTAVTLSSQKGTFQGGFILREGNIETNCTYEVLIMGIQEEMEPKVAAVLFP